MNKVYFSPWIDVGTYHWERKSFSKIYFVYLYDIHRLDNYSCSACIDGMSIYHIDVKGKINAFNHMNKWLADNKCVLLSQEQWDKYQLLK
jgi:hypothetical protein